MHPAPDRLSHQQPPAAALELRNVAYAYDRRPVLHHVDLTVPLGNFTAIIGPNGGGKSTLLKLTLGQLEADAHVEGLPVEEQSEGRPHRRGGSLDRPALDEAVGFVGFGPDRLVEPSIDGGGRRLVDPGRSEHAAGLGRLGLRHRSDQPQDEERHPPLTQG